MPSEQDRAIPLLTASSAAKRYLGFTLAGNLVWEVLQLPLYTLWNTASVGSQAFAVLHCTGGDLLISASCLALAWLLLGRGRWPQARRAEFAILTMLFGLAYTLFSEWLNVTVRGSWAYSDLMPLVPLGFFSAGLSPLLQWLVVPAVAFRQLSRSTITKAP